MAVIANNHTFCKNILLPHPKPQEFGRKCLIPKLITIQVVQKTNVLLAKHESMKRLGKLMLSTANLLRI